MTLVGWPINNPLSDEDQKVLDEVVKLLEFGPLGEGYAQCDHLTSQYKESFDKFYERLIYVSEEVKRQVEDIKHQNRDNKEERYLKTQYRLDYLLEQFKGLLWATYRDMRDMDNYAYAIENFWKDSTIQVYKKLKK